MKKEKLNTEDGSEFTVFYLGETPNKNGQIIDDVYGFGEGYLESDEVVSVGDAFEDYINQEEVLIDDTIERDLVDEPVRGRLYRVHGINIIARFKDWAYVSGIHSKKFVNMSLHGTEFLVAEEDLRIATLSEVDEYFEKSV
tara:strand:- start:16702 stop:17124 length:423 start_codon:yes stop_codon:yes gene_type:complete